MNFKRKFFIPKPLVFNKEREYRERFEINCSYYYAGIIRIRFMKEIISFNGYNLSPSFSKVLRILQGTPQLFTQRYYSRPELIKKLEQFTGSKR